jgi:hypothetical protein
VDSVTIDEDNIIPLIVDMATSFLNAYLVTSLTGENVLSSLDDHCILFGFPNRILSDNGREYTYGPISDWTHLHEVCYIFKGVHHLQSNGTMERNARTLTEALRAALISEFGEQSAPEFDSSVKTCPPS